MTNAEIRERMFGCVPSFCCHERKSILYFLKNNKKNLLKYLKKLVVYFMSYTGILSLKDICHYGKRCTATEKITKKLSTGQIKNRCAV